ncbi:unnamed protein product [Calicophoron daubneyi]|uniref:Uncharacterized protein n=1 Tax=Calicophoron daubneyi TaxID=300641 RepID=A0AAV2TPX0_CALDB
MESSNNPGTAYLCNVSFRLSCPPTGHILMEHRVYDLNIPLDHFNAELLARILDSGYHCVAVAQSVNIDDFNFNLKTDENSARKKTKEERQSMRASLVARLKPPSLDNIEKVLADSHKYRASNWSPAVFFRPRIFRRITLHCSDPSLAGLFFREFGEMLNSFDIVSLCPSSAEALAYACDGAPSLDLISLDLTKEGDFRLTGKQCSQIVSRGLHLEYHIRPLLRTGSGGSSARSNLAFSIVNLLASVRQSFTRAIVVSSSAANGWEVRRPLALIAILECLGLKPREVAHNALTKNPYSVLIHGLCRSRTAHGAAALLRVIAMPCVSSIKDGCEVTVKDDGEVPSKKKKLCSADLVKSAFTATP